MTASPAAIDRFHQVTLLGMLAAGYFALVGSLDSPTAVMMLCALVARGFMVAGLLQWRLSNRMAGVLGFVCLVFYPIDERYLSVTLLGATVHLMCFLAAIKILSASTGRDLAWVRVIALLELVAASLVSASPLFFAFLAIFLLCTIAALSSGEVLRSMTEPRGVPQRVVRGNIPRMAGRLSVFSGALFTGILVMTAALFFVLPRTARAALERFVPARYHLPGFSSEVSLGEIGEIKQRSTPVMHVRPFGEGTLPMLHWRGAALSEFDGMRWFNPAWKDEPLRVDRGVLALHEERGVRVGRSIQYEVQLSEIASDTLFFAGHPQTVTVNLPLLRRSAGGSIHVPRGAVTGLRYGVFAVLEDDRAGVLSAPEPLSDPQRRELLELPARLDRRVYRFARDTVAGSATQEEEARAIELRLKRDYTYTLELPSTVPADPVAYFLFERRKGHCEFFASAMAVMLRAVGIPSRVATGFLGGTFNPVTGWQVIRASDAHSWVEAWIDGKGWTTFDPTPPDPNATTGGFFNGLAMLMDAGGQFWQDWILSYDFERQVVLAGRIEQSSKRVRLDWLDGIGDSLLRAGQILAAHWGWPAGVAVAALGTALYGKRARARVREWLRVRRIERGEAEASDATIVYGRMLAVLERRGFRKPPWVTPAEFARMLPASDTHRQVAHLTEVYNRCRFGGRSSEAAQMLALLERIEQG